MGNSTGINDAIWATEQGLVQLLRAAQEGGTYREIVASAQLDTAHTNVASLILAWTKKKPDTPERQFADLFHKLRAEAPARTGRSGKAAAAALLAFKSRCECGQAKDVDAPACETCLALATDRSRRQSTVASKDQQLADQLGATVKATNGRHGQPVSIN